MDFYLRQKLIICCLLLLAILSGFFLGAIMLPQSVLADIIDREAFMAYFSLNLNNSPDAAQTSTALGANIYLQAGLNAEQNRLYNLNLNSQDLNSQDLASNQNNQLSGDNNSRPSSASADLPANSNSGLIISQSSALSDLATNQSAIAPAIAEQQFSNLDLKAEPPLIIIDQAAILAQAQAQAAAEAAQAAPLIAIYTSHSSENYRGQERVDNTHGGVHDVAQALEAALDAYGLPAIYDATIHDYPDYDLAYANSLATMERLKEEYPSIEVFIDIHRDADADTILTTDNGSFAKMMLVVGTDERLYHPNWQQNLGFAEQVHQSLEDNQPGITRRLITQYGRYNQHISPQAILVEMGSTLNSTAEAINSASILAKALYDIL